MDARPVQVPVVEARSFPKNRWIVKWFANHSLKGKGRGWDITKNIFLSVTTKGVQTRGNLVARLVQKFSNTSSPDSKKPIEGLEKFESRNAVAWIVANKVPL